MSKYSKDGPERMSIKNFCDRLKIKIGRGDTSDELCDFIDDEFIYGAYAEYEFNSDFLRDIRAIFIEMYDDPKRKTTK